MCGRRTPPARLSSLPQPTSPSSAASLLGLDRLAAQKRAEQAKGGGDSVLGKRPLLSLGEDEEAGGQAEEAGGGGGGGGGESVPVGLPRDQRHYRGQRIETPSHPGGVSDRARESAAERERRQRERERGGGVYASTHGAGGVWVCGGWGDWRAAS